MGEIAICGEKEGKLTSFPIRNEINDSLHSSILI